MVDYYKTLGVKRTATVAEIKSAYRKLARERHPDHNGGSTQAAREFALIAMAYRTLSDHKRRADYDAQCERARHRGAFVSPSASAHVRRASPVSAQARMDMVVDRMLAIDRRETLELQQAVYPTVALFLSIFFAALLRPHFWQSFGLIGRAGMLTLFLIGVWHLRSRLIVCLGRYSYKRGAAEEASASENEAGAKPFTRLRAYSFIVTGALLSFGIGDLLGEQSQYLIFRAMPFFFDQHLHPELLFYPPIVVLIVDTLHTVGLKLDL